MASKIPIMLLLLATLVAAASATAHTRARYETKTDAVLGADPEPDGRKLMGSAGPVLSPSGTTGAVVGAEFADNHNPAMMKFLESNNRKLMSIRGGAALFTPQVVVTKVESAAGPVNKVHERKLMAALSEATTRATSKAATTPSATVRYNPSALIRP